MDQWLLYQNTVFLMPKPLSKRLDFAIVTAHNPRGKLLSEQANHHRDLQLAAELTAAGVKAQSLWGCSPDLKHREKSWALVMAKTPALALGQKLEQNAIFWVQNDELYLLPCLLEQPPCFLGLFSERIVECPTQG
ncbi:DUF3293 domain-containing protein [Gallaecimonas pentaromativorans]|uniref:Uncharacterized protein DUF3293 n=2 Tax=Gallaecimonas pentaromativorans TaxID=584787 RepID=A0A3N1PQZ8_9GAMM|nr:DUF3293 domain-containing protein [Gallaecimonas pentaromativorans]MED5523233.1 DUF3293 domain-containing protein [Pseudomonadota bacterium]ROQ30428.1 uncharacterized protein DUF3293 [Gallaecimonas pentaromativorans]